jgi:acetyl-CoA acyltransferase
MMSQVPMSGFHTQLHPEMAEAYIGMGYTAERVAERWGINRQDQDAWAYRSHQNALKAQEKGAFAGQVVPVVVKRVNWNGSKRSAEEMAFTTDELPRADTSPERLAKLKPAFKEGGTVTAGNASPYSDGAAALLMMSADKATELGLKPIAKFISFATGGVDPDIMGVGPIKAVPKALAKAGIKLDDLKLIEFNEAFAAQVLAVVRELGINTDLVNVNGGAIALGHPLGATGSKLTTQLIHELGGRGGGLGLVTMCIGGGMGAAGVFEVMPA